MYFSGKFLQTLSKNKTGICNVVKNYDNAIWTRHSSYLTSTPVRPIEEYQNVEICHNPPEWKYVERLMPQLTVPKLVEKSQYHSGWRPQKKFNLDELNYFVTRTKNHMMPVYLQTRFRGLRRITVVRRIQGDIWQLERELRTVVEKDRNEKLCATRVNEMSGQIQIHGDYVDVVREFLKAKGY